MQSHPHMHKHIYMSINVTTNTHYSAITFCQFPMSLQTYFIIWVYEILCHFSLLMHFKISFVDIQ